MKKLLAKLLAATVMAGLINFFPAPNFETENFQISVAAAKTKNHSIPKDAVKYKGHYFYVFDNCNTWEEAEKYCESLDGHLAIIKNAKANAKIYQIMIDFGYKSAYFGLTDAGHEGTWTWVNGKPLKYSNWNSTTHEPNGRDRENYAMFYWKFTDGKWNDGSFSNYTDSGKKAFICEWD